MQGFMITLLTCSATMSLLALIYMAVTPFLAKRYSVKGRYYAWLVIVAGMIIPFRPHFDNAFVKVDVPSGTAVPIIQIGNGTPVTIPAENAVLPSASLSISWWQVAAAIWLVGVIIYLSHHALKHYRFTKMVGRWSEKVINERTLTLLQSLKTEMGISGQINLYLCSSVGSPMMIGFTNPRILLRTADIAQDELRFILKHELFHYKRKDLWYKSLVLIATAIHWFNPVVYLMAKAINVQCELSCDAEIVRSADADTRQHYSETIIGIVRYQSKLKTALSTNFYGGKKGMKERIFSIMDMSKKKTGVSIICGVLLVTLGTGFAFAANASTSQTNFTATENTGTYDMSASYEKYNEYGLTYDKATDAIAEETTLTPDELANEYAIYEPFGLTYDKNTDSFYYNSKLVREFQDIMATNGKDLSSEDFSGTIRQLSNDNGEIDVYTVRDFTNLDANGYGKLTGIKVGD